jgi:hypothetical protein
MRANTTLTVKLMARTYISDTSGACGYAALLLSRCS